MLTFYEKSFVKKHCNVYACKISPLANFFSHCRYLDLFCMSTRKRLQLIRLLQPHYVSQMIIFDIVHISCDWPRELWTNSCSNGFGQLSRVQFVRDSIESLPNTKNYKKDIQNKYVITFHMKSKYTGCFGSNWTKLNSYFRQKTINGIQKRDLRMFFRYGNLCFYFQNGF